GIALGADGPPRGDAVPQESVGEVNLFASGLGQRSITLMPDDTNYFDPFWLRGANADEDALSHDGFVWKGFRREKLVNDHHIPLRRIVRLGERASREERRAERFKITREHGLKIHRLKFGRVGERLLRAPADRAEPSRERERTGGRHAFDARQRPQPALNLAHESGALLRLGPAARA